MVSQRELVTAWAEVVHHDRTGFEVPDPIGFADGGPGGTAWRGGPWAATGRVALAVPVANPAGGRRMLCVLDPGVHALYRALVARVAPFVERTLGPSVTANRCRPSHGAGLRLEPWRRARRRHDRLVRSLAVAESGGRSGRRGTLDGPFLRADVRNCYSSIAPDAVTDALRAAGAPGDDMAGLERLLVRFGADGIPGLPVGPEPSAVLANAVLLVADRALAGEGAAFVRWVDDVVARPRAGDWTGALEAFRAALAGAGLRPADEKCGPTPIGSALRPGLSGRRGTRPRPVPDVRSPDPSGASSDGRRDGRWEEWHAAVAGDDPFDARAAVARAALMRSLASRGLLREARRRHPDMATTVEWGLAR